MIFGPVNQEEKILTWRFMYAIAVLAHCSFGQLTFLCGNLWSLDWVTFLINLLKNVQMHSFGPDLQTGPKIDIRTIWKWTKTQFNWTKRWSPNSNALLDQKSYPRMQPTTTRPQKTGGPEPDPDQAKMKNLSCCLFSLFLIVFSIFLKGFKWFFR